MKYYVKLALITLVVSVAAAEIFGPMVGMRGYIGPVIMGLLSGDAKGVDTNGEVNIAQLAPPPTSDIDNSDVTSVSSAQPMTPDEALDACVGALKSVSLHPEFAQIPAVKPVTKNGVYTFNWPKTTPTRMMNSSGKEQNLTAACRIGEDGRFRTLLLDKHKLFSDANGKASVNGTWRISRVISKADRSTNVTVSTRAEKPVVVNGTELTPTLVLHCGENKTVSYIKLGADIGAGRISVKSTADNDEQTLRWSISTDGKNIYQGSRYITLLRQLAAASRYTVSFSPNGQEAVSLSFSLKGLKAAINPLQEACHWR